MHKLVVSTVAVLALLCSTGYSHGREVQKKTGVSRIVSLGPINTENVFILGAGDLLVGNTKYCVRPTEAKLISKVGTMMHFSMEKLLSLQPDLVLATGLTNVDQLERLDKMGIRVERFSQPKSLAESCQQFLRLGKLLAREEKAEQIIQSVWQQVEMVKTRIEGMSKQRVFLQIGTQPLYGAAPGSFTHDFIQFSGGENILSNEISGKTNLERIIGENPDVILIAIMGSETGLAGQEKRRWLSFSNMKAAKSKRIHIVDPDLICSPSPRTFVEALTQIIELIHPGIKVR